MLELGEPLEKVISLTGLSEEDISKQIKNSSL